MKQKTLEHLSFFPFKVKVQVGEHACGESNVFNKHDLVSRSE